MTTPVLEMRKQGDREHVALPTKQLEDPLLYAVGNHEPAKSSSLPFRGPELYSLWAGLSKSQTYSSSPQESLAMTPGLKIRPFFRTSTFTSEN